MSEIRRAFEAAVNARALPERASGRVRTDVPDEAQKPIAVLTKHRFLDVWADLYAGGPATVRLEILTDGGWRAYSEPRVISKGPASWKERVKIDEVFRFALVRSDVVAIVDCTLEGSDDPSR